MSHPSGCNLAGLRQGLWETRPPRQGCGRQAQRQVSGRQDLRETSLWETMPLGDKPPGDKASRRQGLSETRLWETRPVADKAVGDKASGRQASGLWETRPPGDKPLGDKPLGDKASGRQGLWETSLREQARHPRLFI